MSTVCGTGIGNFPKPGDPDLNSIVLSVQARVGAVYVSWTYPALNAHAVAYTLLYRSTSDDFETAGLPRTVTGSSFLDPVQNEEATTYYYWIRLVSVFGTEGDLIGPASVGMLAYGDMLAGMLANQIRANQLHIDLRTAIERLPVLEQQILVVDGERISANQYLADLLAQYGVTLAAIDTVVLDEITARTTADSAIVEAINIIGAVVDDNAAAIITEQTARADADSAMASQITTLISGVGLNTSAIQTEQTVRADADTAMAQSITLLETNVGDSLALINTELTTQSGAVSSLASSFTGLQASVGTDLSTFQSTLSALVDENTAIAQSVETVQTTLGENTSAIEVISTATNGLKTEYSVKLDSNGYAIGFGAYNEGPGLNGFVVSAELFAVATGSNVIHPFVIEGSEIRFNGVVSFANLTGTPPPELKGDDGVTLYTWVRYATSAAGANISSSPTNRTYIGFAYNKTSATASNTPGDYVWSLIKGADGSNGTNGYNGTNGADGASFYTFVRYSNNSNGSGMYETPNSGTLYMGIVTNWAGYTAPTNYLSYTWSKIKGNDGGAGTAGASSTTVFRRATSVTTPSSGTANPPSGWSSTIPAGSNPVWECVGNRAAGSTIWVWNTPAVSAEFWAKPATTLIDGNKIFTGEAYVDTLEIKGNAVHIAQGGTGEYGFAVGTGWTNVGSVLINWGVNPPQKVLVSGHMAAEQNGNLTTGGVELRLISSNEAGRSDMNMSAVNGATVSMSTGGEFGGFTGSVTYYVQVRCTIANSHRVQRWSIMVWGAKR